MHIRFEPMDTATATHLRNGGLDSNGNPPEQKISDGNGVPCRVCMKMVGKGEPYLVMRLAAIQRNPCLRGNRTGVLART